MSRFAIISDIATLARDRQGHIYSLTVSRALAREIYDQLAMLARAPAATFERVQTMTVHGIEIHWPRD